MNAIDLLKEDHQRVDRLFKKVRDTPKGEHPALFKQIYAELDVHTHLEEKIFYPALIKDGDKSLEDITREGIEEHRQAKMFLSELKSLKPANKQYEAKLTVLMEDIEHHVKEEEGDMFKQAEDQLSDEAMERLTKRMEREKVTYVKALPAAEKTALNHSLAAGPGKSTVQSIIDQAKDLVGGLLPGSNGDKGNKAASKKTAAKQTPVKTGKKTTAKKGRKTAKTRAAASGK